MITQGDAVRDWQKSLSEAGYDPGELNGEWTEETSAATKKFQGDNGLAVDGKVTREVREAMREKLSGAEPEKETPAPASAMPPFYKRPLFWVAASGAIFVGFMAWKTKDE